MFSNTLTSPVLEQMRAQPNIAGIYGDYDIGKLLGELLVDTHRRRGVPTNGLSVPSDKDLIFELIGRGYAVSTLPAEAHADEVSK